MSKRRHKQQKTEKAIKGDYGKLRFDLVPPIALSEVVKIYTYGAIKYGDKNWQNGMSWGRVFAAAMRHLWRFWSGEERDEESGLLHLAHAAWGMFTLMEYGRFNKKLDDRSKL